MLVRIEEIPVETHRAERPVVPVRAIAIALIRKVGAARARFGKVALQDRIGGRCDAPVALREREMPLRGTASLGTIRSPGTGDAFVIEGIVEIFVAEVT